MTSIERAEIYRTIADLYDKSCGCDGKTTGTAFASMLREAARSAGGETTCGHSSYEICAGYQKCNFCGARNHFDGRGWTAAPAPAATTAPLMQSSAPILETPGPAQPVSEPVGRAQDAAEAGLTTRAVDAASTGDDARATTGVFEGERSASSVRPALTAHSASPVPPPAPADASQGKALEEEILAFPVHSDLHDDSKNLVRLFAQAVAYKLHRAQIKYGYSNGWLTDDWEHKCRADLHRHIGKGDPLDVAIYAAFMWHRAWATSNTVPSTPAAQGEVSQTYMLPMNVEGAIAVLDVITKMDGPTTQKNWKILRDYVHEKSRVVPTPAPPESGLRECPGCGASNIGCQKSEFEMWKRICSQCGWSGPATHSLDEATAAWNERTRAPSSAQGVTTVGDVRAALANLAPSQTLGVLAHSASLMGGYLLAPLPDGHYIGGKLRPSQTVTTVGDADVTIDRLTLEKLIDLARGHGYDLMCDFAAARLQSTGPKA